MVVKEELPSRGVERDADRNAISLLSLPFFLEIRRLQRSTLFPYTTLFRSEQWTPGHARLWWESRLDAEPVVRSEEHTSELQSRENLVCRLLLEKKKLSQL